METIEGNKLIAEFMGGVYKDLAYIRDTFPVIEFKDETHGLHCHPIKGLKYHSSWDWIMPALKKYGDLPANYNTSKDWGLIVIGLGAIDIDMTWNFFVSALKKLITTKPQPHASPGNAHR